jgi:predicted Fe-Mo cluster-binding NifX family protein
LKIAVVTDDRETVSQHFGRAQQYVVTTFANGRIENREVRNKLGHMHFEGEHGHEDDPQHHHGPEAEHRHNAMIEPVENCEALICGGMGSGAYEAIRAQGIRPVVTDIRSIDDAVKAYTNGQLKDHTERLHH